MKIYHGSKVVITKPREKGSNPTNDYGPSFYLTTDLNEAKSWACRNDSLGLVNEYEIDNRSYQKLKILDLTNKSKYHILNWLAILMHFRELTSSFRKINQPALDWLNKYYIDVNEYDVVIGYRADDSYFRFPIRFISGDLAYEDLEDIYLSGNLGIQYAFMSSRAINLLSFKKVFECEPSFIGHYYSMTSEATHHFDEILSMPRDLNKTYILDLMRKDNE